jgi:phosphoribosylpyrophosphate synthetase
MILAMQKVKKAGAAKIFCAATHGIFGWDSLEKLRKKSDGVISTDSIVNEAESITLANEISKVI